MKCNEYKNPTNNGLEPLLWNCTYESLKAFGLNLTTKCSYGLVLKGSGSNTPELSMGGIDNAIHMTAILHLDRAQKQDLNGDPTQRMF